MLRISNSLTLLNYMDVLCAALRFPISCVTNRFQFMTRITHVAAMLLGSWPQRLPRHNLDLLFPSTERRMLAQNCTFTRVPAFMSPMRSLRRPTWWCAAVALKRLEWGILSLSPPSPRPAGKEVYPSFVDLYSGWGLKKGERARWDGKPHYDREDTKAALGWNSALHPEYDAAECFVPREGSQGSTRRRGLVRWLTHRQDGIVTRYGDAGRFG